MKAVRPHWVRVVTPVEDTEETCIEATQGETADSYIHTITPVTTNIR